MALIGIASLGLHGALAQALGALDLRAMWRRLKD
jgi:hypothetical protein